MKHLNGETIFAPPGPNPNSAATNTGWRSAARSGQTRHFSSPIGKARGCAPASRGRALCPRSRSAPASSPAPSTIRPLRHACLPEQHHSGQPLRSHRHSGAAALPVCRMRPARNNYVRTAVEPDNQDQFDTRIDHVFNDKHRAFARYSYLRDDDTPVTSCPRAAAISLPASSDTPSRAVTASRPSTIGPSRRASLNQARFGYTRRDVNQASLQNGGITVPGAPGEYLRLRRCPSSPSRAISRSARPPPPTPNFTTSVTEYLDTFSMVRGRHTIKFGTDIRREALDIVNPANPTGSYASPPPARTLHRRRRQRAGLTSAGPGECLQHRHSERRHCRARPHRRVLHRRRLEGLGPPHASTWARATPSTSLQRKSTTRTRSST